MHPTVPHGLSFDRSKIRSKDVVRSQDVSPDDRTILQQVLFDDPQESSRQRSTDCVLDFLANIACL
jgi:hypothetical protein